MRQVQRGPGPVVMRKDVCTRRADYDIDDWSSRFPRISSFRLQIWKHLSRGDYRKSP
jgi:hypothetical protein